MVIFKSYVKLPEGITSVIRAAETKHKDSEPIHPKGVYIEHASNVLRKRLSQWSNCASGTIKQHTH